MKEKALKFLLEKVLIPYLSVNGILASCIIQLFVILLKLFDFIQINWFLVFFVIYLYIVTLVSTVVFLINSINQITKFEDE
jgi:hypothetical protein